jgi:hypothetical protein
MATKPGSTGNERKNLFTANASENYGKRRHYRTKQHQRVKADLRSSSDVGLEDEQERTL